MQARLNRKRIETRGSRVAEDLAGHLDFPKCAARDARQLPVWTRGAHCPRLGGH